MAGLYLAFRRPDLARETLLEGLQDLPADPAYWETTLSFLLSVQEDERLLEPAKQNVEKPTAANAA